MSLSWKIIFSKTHGYSCFFKSTRLSLVFSKVLGYLLFSQKYSYFLKSTRLYPIFSKILGYLLFSQKYSAISYFLKSTRLSLVFSKVLRNLLFSSNYSAIKYFLRVPRCPCHVGWLAVSYYIVNIRVIYLPALLHKSFREILLTIVFSRKRNFPSFVTFTPKRKFFFAKIRRHF